MPPEAPARKLTPWELAALEACGAMLGYDWIDWKSWNGGACLNRRLPEEPVDAEGFRERGNRYGRYGNYDMAIRDLSRAIELEPGFADTYYDRGCSFYEAGMYEEAVADLSRAIELNPEGAKYYSQRSIVYLFMDQMVLAESDQEMSDSLREQGFE